MVFELADVGESAAFPEGGSENEERREGVIDGRRLLQLEIQSL